jgi:hypothetical protein
VPKIKIKATLWLFYNFYFIVFKTGSIDEGFIMQWAKELDRNEDSSLCK